MCITSFPEENRFIYKYPASQALNQVFSPNCVSILCIIEDIQPSAISLEFNKENGGMNMQPRQLRYRKTSKNTLQRYLIRYSLFLLFILILFLFVALLWEQPAMAPEQKKPDPLTLEEIQVLEEERKLLEEERKHQLLVELEASYYEKEEMADLVLQSEWTLMPTTISPGDVLLIRHHEPNEVVWEGETYTLKPFGTGYYTYIPMSINMKPGEYTIGDTILTVKEKVFDAQYLEVSNELESITQDEERIQADQVIIDEARSKSKTKFLFTSDSKFMMPLEGELTTPYGYTRYVNGKFSGSHRAIDIAAPEGTPVKASNDGIVALAEEFYLTGNSIYIDHGMDLFSQYIHLSELKVEAGDRVKQGDVIGLVGSTGFSTGPHLHFTFWAHNVPVNPNLFFDQTPFDWLDS